MLASEIIDMSNLTILERLEEKLASLEQGMISAKDFAHWLDASTEALEALPYDKILKSRTLQFEVQDEGFAAEEEGFVTRFPAVIVEIRNWIDELKKINCQQRASAGATESAPAER